MKVLLWTFIGMFWYGVIVGPQGAGLLAFAMAAFVYWADKRFTAQDKAWASDPRNAPKPPCTRQVLDQAGVECSEPKDRS